MARKMWRHRITSAGQVSLPAEVRHRWETSAVLIEDEGDRLVLRPVPTDPVEGLRGVLKGKARADISASEAVRRWREEDNAAMERKWREYYGGVVVDAGPVVSLLLDDAAAADVAGELAAHERIEVSVVNVAEIVDVLRRVHRADPEHTALAVGRFLDEVADPVAATRELAERAADIRARHYHRRDRDVSLADCFVIATAWPDRTVATSDRAVARIARDEGLDVLSLPNPRGRRP